MTVRARGVVLVLVSGLLVVVSLLSVFFLRMVVLTGVASRGEALHRGAGLSAESGLEYAAARLWDDPLPVPAPVRTQANAADDWTCRDLLAVPSPAASPNPSYRRGGHFQDLDGNGLYLPIADGDPTASAGWDPDGNGVFDAWSGRLRGAGDPFASRFSLKIDSLGGRVCVNSGELGAPLGDHDLDGRLNRDDLYDAASNPTGWREDLDANGVPDWRDPRFAGNIHLVNLLNNLGAIVGVSSAGMEPYAKAPPSFGPGDPELAMGEVESSSTGIRIVKRRPLGGYGSWGEVRDALGEADFAKLRPYLSLMGEILPVSFPDTSKDQAFHRFALEPEARYEFHARVDLNQAPVEVLQACLRYLTASGTHYASGVDTVMQTPFIRLGKDEADAVAAELVRERPIRTWRRLLEVLAAIPDGTIFTDDPFTIGIDESQGVSRRLKEDLILAQADANVYWPDPLSWRRNCLEVPGRDAEGIDSTRVRRIFKSALAGPLNTAPYDAAGAFHPTDLALANAIGGIPPRMTTEFSLAPLIGRFQVEAEGHVRGGTEGGTAARVFQVDLELSRPVVLTGQQDFERLTRRFADPSAPDDRWDSPGGRFHTQGGLQERSGLQSGPRFPVTQGDGTTNFTPEGIGWPVGEEPLLRAQFSYPRVYGDLRLAAAPPPQLQSAGCVLGFPFNEGGDPAGWLDNIADPVGRPLPYSACEIYGKPPSENWQVLAKGLLMSPWGVRIGEKMNPMGEGVVSGWGTTSNTYSLKLSVLWNQGSLFPLERDAYDRSPVPVAGKGEIRGMTLEFLAPAHGGENPFPGHAEGRVQCEYEMEVTVTEVGQPADRGDPQFRNYFTLFSLPSDKLGWSSNEGMLPRRPGRPQMTIPPAGVAPWTPGAGWGHVALVFMEDPAVEDRSTVQLYVDGALVGTTSANTPIASEHKIDAGPPRREYDLHYVPTGAVRIGFSDFPVDDFLVHDRIFNAADVGLAAQRPRYERVGTYLSPRFAANPSTLSRIALQGIAWDGFIPEGSGGRIELEVVAYDSAGSEIGRSDRIPWTQADYLDGKTAPIARAVIPGSVSSIALWVRIEAVDSSVWPQVLGVPTLRDTPILDECVLHVGDRPRFFGYAAR